MQKYVIQFYHNLLHLSSKTQMKNILNIHTSKIRKIDKDLYVFQVSILIEVTIERELDKQKTDANRKRLRQTDKQMIIERDYDV